jgi:hypothetical protein
MRQESVYQLYSTSPFITCVYIHRIVYTWSKLQMLTMYLAVSIQWKLYIYIRRLLSGREEHGVFCYFTTLEGVLHY